MFLGATDRSGLVRWLSPEERARADRFYRHMDRARFIESHAALRLILGRYRDLPPCDVVFAQEAGGKPVLAPAQRAGLHFNLSHSGAHALIGVSHCAPIGVDVEAIRPVGDPLAIVRAHFHPVEIAALAGAPHDRQAPLFFQCWTRKEAVVKALGMGLALPLDGFSVDGPSPVTIRWEGEDPASDGWSLIDLDIETDVVGAVAIPLADHPCRLFRLPANWAELA
ncbi:4'-phosphopantetheinyl transferase family protein [Methylobacterium sp. M6A4_1b]